MGFWHWQCCSTSVEMSPEDKQSGQRNALLIDLPPQKAIMKGAAKLLIPSRRSQAVQLCSNKMQVGLSCTTKATDTLQLQSAAHKMDPKASPPET